MRWVGERSKVYPDHEYSIGFILNRRCPGNIGCDYVKKGAGERVHEASTVREILAGGGGGVFTLDEVVWWISMSQILCVLEWYEQECTSNIMHRSQGLG